MSRYWPSWTGRKRGRCELANQSGQNALQSQLKGQFTPNSKIRLYWRLLSLEYQKSEIGGARLEELKVQKTTLEKLNSNVSFQKSSPSYSTKKILTFFVTFLSIQLHPPTVPPHRRKCQFCNCFFPHKLAFGKSSRAAKM